MKALIVGYGSMGRRRIRLLNKLVDELSVICVDSNPQRLKQIKDDGYTGFSLLKDAINDKPDIAFVCTSPGHHAEIILKLIDARIHTFTELNLVSDYYEDIITKADDKDVCVFMSSTMLYDKQVQAINQVIKEKTEPLTYIYHVGQYLPDWHPWESYKDFFIGAKKTNGCREILAIQLPWLIKCFGKFKTFSAIKKRNTKLDIDFYDTYIITSEHENGNTGVFICDVLARRAVNSLEIMGENTHIIWQGTPESLLSFNEDSKNMVLLPSYENTEHIEGYADIIAEDQYVDEIKAFLSYVKYGEKPLYDLKDDKYVLDIIDKIEE